MPEPTPEPTPESTPEPTPVPTPEPDATLETTGSQVSLAVTNASDGSEYEYELSDPDAVTDFSITVTGVERSVPRTYGGTVSMSDSQPLDVGGNAAPTGPASGSPQLSITATGETQEMTAWQRADLDFGDVGAAVFPAPDGLVDTARVCVQTGTGSDATIAAYAVRGDDRNSAIDGERVGEFTVDPSYEVECETIDLGGWDPGPVDEITIELEAVDDGGQGYLGFYPPDRSSATISTTPPTDISVSADDGTSVTGLSDGSTVAFPVTANATSLSFSAPDGGEIEYALTLRERTLTVDPSVEVNGHRTTHSGTLTDGDTVSLTTDTTWLESGTNTVTVGVGGAESVSPAPLVDVQYGHALSASPAESTESTDGGGGGGGGGDGSSGDGDGGDGSSGDGSAGGGGGGGGGGAALGDFDADDADDAEGSTATPTVVDEPTEIPNSSSVLTSASNGSGVTIPDADDTVVTDVSVQSDRISMDTPATISVTVANPQDVADTHTVELELFGQIVNSREVTVPANGVTTVQFTHNIVAPGTYTARVDDETATIRVVDPGQSTATPTSTSTSTQFPGFGAGVALLAVALATLLFVRRE